MLFPWECYHNGPDSLPFTLDISNPTMPQAQSKLCLGSLAMQDLPCDECADVPAHIARLAEVARDPKSRTNYRYLGLAHMQDIARSYAKQANTLKLQGLNDSHKHIKALTQLDNHHRLLMVVSENNIPCLQQIITAWWMAASIRPQPKTQTPSLRTLRTCASFTTITPTIGPIRDEHIHANIHTIVLATQSPTSPKCGVSLMIDEITLEEMAVHFSKYNQVGGLCWKHSHLVNPVLRTYKSAINIAQKIHAGQVHLGKELTVIGASFFDEDDIYPLLAAPTCKAEDATDMEQLLAQVINCWSIAGAGASAGPIWSFAMDGDTTRRTARHKLFLKNALAPESPLYGTLINMPGLNLFTGDDEVTLDFNYKHILKHTFFLI
ncbi:hypothetical protein EDD22DRAFT_955328 [Suillus occidentalis]|nr:hypothetical protein EDD22DRAFT_955328 [Suillus occidentalis]